MCVSSLTQLIVCIVCLVNYLEEEIALSVAEGGSATLEQGPAAGLGDDRAGVGELAVRRHDHRTDVAGALGKLQPSWEHTHNHCSFSYKQYHHRHLMG